MPHASTRARTVLLCALALALAAVPGIAFAKVIRGSAKADRLIGTTRADVITGGRGNDTIDGRGGRDRLDGGPGNDLIVAGGDATVVGGSGNDRIRITAARLRFHVSCGAGRDTLSLFTDVATTVRKLRFRARGCENITLARLSSAPKGVGGGSETGLSGAAPAGSSVTSGTGAGGGAGAGGSGGSGGSSGGGGVPSPGTPTGYADPVPSPPPSTAPTRFVATGGSDSGSCTGAAPCKTLSRAYTVASSGEVIEVAPGVYPAQNVPGGTKAVTFYGPGAALRELDNSADNVTFDKIDVDGNHAVNNTFENHGSSNVTYKNSRIGNVTDEKGGLVSGDHFTFDNMVFHDAILQTSGTHMECVYAIGVDYMTVRNSMFYNCAIMDLAFTYGDWWTPQPPAYGNVTLENNVFGHSTQTQGDPGWHYFSLNIGATGPGGGTMRNWVVRNNTFENAAQLNYPASNSRWVGNVGDWNCETGVTFRRNAGFKCAATDKSVSPASSTATTTAPFGWLNPALFDFTLKPGSPAIDAADPADAPATDRFGKTRGAAPDAGAYER